MEIKEWLLIKYLVSFGIVYNKNENIMIHANCKVISLMTSSLNYPSHQFENSFCLIRSLLIHLNQLNVSLLGKSRLRETVNKYLIKAILCTSLHLKSSRKAADS